MLNSGIFEIVALLVQVSPEEGGEVVLAPLVEVLFLGEGLGDLALQILQDVRDQSLGSDFRGINFLD